MGVRVPGREKIVSMEFMRKYIHVAKIIKPVLTEESASYIAEEYSRLRSQDQINSDVARVSDPGSALELRLGWRCSPLLLSGRCRVLSCPRSAPELWPGVC